MAAEIAAFANAKGGRILYGINDKSHDIFGLEIKDLARIQSLIADVCRNLISPTLYPETEVVSVNNKMVLVITIPESEYKPHMDKDGIIWIKSASDKRKVNSPDEISRLFQSGKRYYADKQPVHDAYLDDLDINKYEKYFEKTFGRPYTEFGLSLEKTLESQNLLKGEHPTLSGMLFFGKMPQLKLPTFVVKCIHFVGNDLSGKHYRDSEDIDGTLDEQYKKTMLFLARNIQKVQNGKDFNTIGDWRISEDSLKEVVQNALVHRDYFKNSPIMVFIFDNRIEVVSPGKLPNSLTVDNIKFGQSVPRNNTIVSIAARLMPYRGVGSGIMRTLAHEPNTELINDTDGDRFIVRFPMA